MKDTATPYDQNQAIISIQAASQVKWFLKIISEN
jgi:hypothetical protein